MTTPGFRGIGRGATDLPAARAAVADAVARVERNDSRAASILRAASVERHLHASRGEPRFEHTAGRLRASGRVETIVRIDGVAHLHLAKVEAPGSMLRVSILQSTRIAGVRVLRRSLAADALAILRIAREALAEGIPEIGDASVLGAAASHRLAALGPWPTIRIGFSPASSLDLPATTVALATPRSPLRMGLDGGSLRDTTLEHCPDLGLPCGWTVEIDHLHLDGIPTRCVDLTQVLLEVSPRIDPVEAMRSEAALAALTRDRSGSSWTEPPREGNGA